MTSLEKQIRKTESELKLLLEKFFINVFPEDLLISHGLAHHRRVWNYATEIIMGIDEHIPPDFTRKLIIATYLHDVGMVKEPGINHGKHSGKFCRDFLDQNKISFMDNNDLLFAIENHDNKSYSEDIKDNILLKILSVADDLDAFGHIGIYRYAEIYLLRNIRYPELGKMILENVSSRYNNFVKVCEKNNNIINRHFGRYNQIVGFFESYNRSVNDYEFDNMNPRGYCGVINIISMIINNIYSYKQAIEVFSNHKDQIIRSFFTCLKTEAI